MPRLTLLACGVVVFVTAGTAAVRQPAPPPPQPRATGGFDSTIGQNAERLIAE